MFVPRQTVSLTRAKSVSKTGEAKHVYLRYRHRAKRRSHDSICIARRPGRVCQKSQSQSPDIVFVFADLEPASVDDFYDWQTAAEARQIA